MKLRSKKDNSPAFSDRFNTSSAGEIVVHHEEGDCSSDYPSNYEFWLEKSQEWVEFTDKRIIPDNYHRYFMEAKSEEDLERGYYF